MTTPNFASENRLGYEAGADIQLTKDTVRTLHYEAQSEILGHSFVTYINDNGTFKVKPINAEGEVFIGIAVPKNDNKNVKTNEDGRPRFYKEGDIVTIYSKGKKMRFQLSNELNDFNPSSPVYIDTTNADATKKGKLTNKASITVDDVTTNNVLIPNAQWRKPEGTFVADGFAIIDIL